jgi:FkbM family methyltransferase
MALIHTQPINYLLRSILKPFSKFLPKKYYFAIDGRIKVKLTEGKQLIFEANPTSNLLRVLFWNGIKGFEFQEYEIFTNLIKDCKCFFDIGANIGYYSIVAKKFNSSISVHGFEPLPSARKYFEINAALNNIPDIFINEIAISNKNGTATFHSNINPRFRNLKDHLFGDNSLDINSTGNFDRVKLDVKTQTLDSYVEQYLTKNEKIDLIKMDTEGTENLVLQGANIVLTDHRPIIMCEIIHGVIEKEVGEIMVKNNYSFLRIIENRLELTNKLIIDGAKENYFFVPAEKMNIMGNYLDSKR